LIVNRDNNIDGEIVIVRGEWCDRFGVKKSFVFLEITIGGDCDGEKDDDDGRNVYFHC